MRRWTGAASTIPRVVTRNPSGSDRNLAGVDYTYEKPRNPEVTVSSETDPVDRSVSCIVALMRKDILLRNVGTVRILCN